MIVFFFFFQAEDGIRDLVRSRGLGDVYKRQGWVSVDMESPRVLHRRPGWLMPDYTAIEYKLVGLSLIHI